MEQPPLWTWIHLSCLKGELKAEISNFSNIFFTKSNISEVNFVKLFSLVYCFLRENYVRNWIFPAFATSSLWARKLNQQPAVTYDMGKDGEERFRNQEKQGKHKWCTAIHHYGKQTKQADAFLWGVLACLPHIIRHKLQKWPLTLPFWAAMLIAQNRNKKIFLAGKTTDMQEKKLKTLLCMV